MAVFAYVKRGEEPDFGGAMGMLFAVMKNTLDRDGKKWESTCMARSHSKKSTKETNEAKDTNASKDADNDTDTYTENNTDIDTANDTVPLFSEGRLPASRNNKNKSNKNSIQVSQEHSYDLEKLAAYAMTHTPVIKKRSG